MPSRFDYYLQGHDDVFNEDEKEGYRLFIRKGCVTCHNGANLGGGYGHVRVVEKIDDNYFYCSGGNEDGKGLLNSIKYNTMQAQEFLP